ncbi:Amidase [Arthrobotrys entomopaga]|nr:Amidase [Arthrobotrys entomopaga]
MVFLREITIDSYHTALQDGKATVLEVVQYYLQRCKTLDPTLKALICINPNAEHIAKTLDEKLQHLLASGDAIPALFGVPVVVKDTYATADMPTSVGYAPVVSKIKAAGGIIFAKANLHELSCQGVTLSSLGGQTLNPYDLTRTPGGSSGGTAAALAANLGMVGCGGDTMNSIRSPASACSIVGFRPTTGNISTVGIVPVSWTQDTIGPMGRTVMDVKRLYAVMREGRHTVSTGAQLTPKTSREASLKGLRLGVLNNYFLSDPEGLDETRQVREAISSALASLEEQGVILVPFEEHDWAIQKLVREMDVQKFEFKQNLDDFFSSNQGNLLEIGFRSPIEDSILKQILQKDEFDRIALPPATSMIHLATLAVTEPGWMEEYKQRLDAIKHLKTSLASKFQDLNVDTFAYPHQTQLVVKTGNSTQPNRNGLLASLTGHPSLCLPAGFTASSNDATYGVPVGLELLGKWGDDENLLEIGELFEEVLQGRKEPKISQETL